MKSRTRHGPPLREAAFTRMELTIVCVIGGFLALVVPDRDRSVRRSRVVIAKSDHRSLATAIESYFVDFGSYPAERPMLELVEDPSDLARRGGSGLGTLEPGRPGLVGLTTPVAYITALFRDVLPERRWYEGRATLRPYAYHRSADGKGWLLWSTGPDGDYDILDGAAVYDPRERVPSDALIDRTYDPTNGLRSDGDVYRWKM